MIKKMKIFTLFLFLLFGFLLIVPNVNALTITIDDEIINVGELDTLLEWGSPGNSSHAELAWIQSHFPEVEVYTKYEPMDLVSVVNENSNYFAFELSDPAPGYFFIAIGTGGPAGIYDSHWLYENKDSLNWAVVDKTAWGSNPDRIDVFRISHYGEFGGGTAVPEPSTMLLLGMGLIGLAALKRKIAKN